MSNESFDVIVKNVKHTVSEELLKEIFSNYGDVVKCVYMPRNPKYETIMAFIGYSTKAEADRAVESMNDLNIFGEKLKVQIADKRNHSKNASASHSPGNPDNSGDFRSVKTVGMGRGGSSPLLNLSGPANRTTSRPALLKTPPSHRRLGLAKQVEDDVFGKIEQLSISSETSAGSRRPRMSEPPVPLNSNCQARGALRKSEVVGTRPPLVRQAQVRPPTRSFKSGEKAKFYVEFSLLADFTADITCHSDDPQDFAKLHEEYSALKGETAFTVSNPPPVSSYVAAPFEHVYFRGHVLSLEAAGCIKINFIDYGNTEILSIAENKIYPLEEQYIIMKPALFVKCRFGGSDRNMDIFMEKMDQVDPDNPKLILEAEVVDYNESSKLCIINLDTGSKAQASTASVESASADSLMDFKKYLNKETICFPRELPRPDIVIIAPRHLAERITVFDKIVSDCTSFSSNSELAVGELVCAPYADSLFRAVIKKIEKDTAEVYFLDYGNSDEIPLSKLKRFGKGCPKEIHTELAFAVPCKLVGIKPKDGGQYSENFIAEMYQLLSGDEIFVQGMGVMYDPIFSGNVMLANMSTSEVPSFADHLIASNLAERSDDESAKTTEATRNGVKQHNSKPSLSDLGPNKCSQVSKQWLDVVALHVKSPLDFSVLNKAEADKLELLSSSVTKAYEGKEKEPYPHEDLKSGALVVAFSEQFKDFYRGSILRFSTIKNKVEVFYVDYGNQEILPLDNIFPIEDKLMEFPPLAIRCGLKDVSEEDCTEEFSSEMVKILESQESVNIKVEKMSADKQEAMPVKAIVDLRVTSGKFGSQRLVSMMGIVVSCSSSPKTPTSVSKKAGSSSKGKSSAAKPVSSAIKSGDEQSHSKLEARIKTLEDQLVHADNRIFKLERLMYSMVDMTAKSVLEKEDSL